MFRATSKWKIIARNPETNAKDIIIYIYDNYLPNILRKLSDIEFPFECVGFVISKVIE